MIRLRYLILMVIPLALANARAANDPVPLFRQEHTLSLELLIPVDDLLSDTHQESRPFRPGRLIMSDGSDSLAVGVRVTGLSRLEACRAPPLQLSFEPEDVAGTLFEQQQILFLTTHCNRSEKNEQFVVGEYLVYAGLNRLTPMSYRVRLARINYRDMHSDRNLERLAFFIEHPRLMASRNDLESLNLPKVPTGQLDLQQGALVSLYQFLAGNTDWSMIRGPGGSDCCHNTQLIGDRSGVVYPVPYDFDRSGMVDAPYAERNEQLGLKSVRQRLYRGFCDLNGGLHEARSRFSRHRREIEEMYKNQQELTARTLRKSLSYIDSYYEILDDPKRFQKIVLDRCR